MEMYIGDADILLRQTPSLMACGICRNSLKYYNSNVVCSFRCLLRWIELNEITSGKPVLRSELQLWEMYNRAGIPDYLFQLSDVQRCSNRLLMFVSICPMTVIFSCSYFLAWGCTRCNLKVQTMFMVCRYVCARTLKALNPAGLSRIPPRWSLVELASQIVFRLI